MTENYQPQELVYALDIGTRSIIGMVGRAVDGRVEILAIEKQMHDKRAMMDGQIEDIAQVARIVRTVTERLEEQLGCALTQVCIAAAGRALRTQTGRFEMSLPSVRRVDADMIVKLEAGAVSAAEAALIQSGSEQERFYLVGYTPTQYMLDQYPLSTLLDHNGKKLEVEVVATFLPSEVVESLYVAMQQAGLEVVSLTLEPIAAMNAAIPEELRLLNLVLADIGAGTTDIAVCKDGKMVGYTMATVAGDEITEALMQEYLLDFATAEQIKIAMASSSTVTFMDILGFEHEASVEELHAAISHAVENLADELCSRICEVNGGNPPSALFLSGGGSKLADFCSRVADVLKMDSRRVVVAGNNFGRSAFSDAYDLQNPEYATPLGIAVSAGLGLINDSYRVSINGSSAKLFRSGTLTVLDVLMMNGYRYTDLIGRTGHALSVSIDGKRTIFRGEPAVPSVLLLNGKDTAPSAIVNTGDNISFTPAKDGASAKRTLAEVLENAAAAVCATVNGLPAKAEQLLESGDIILTDAIDAAVNAEGGDLPNATKEEVRRENYHFFLNDAQLELAPKADGMPYYLMDMLEHTNLDFEHLDRPVSLCVNGEEGTFTLELKDFDRIDIRYSDEMQM